jgi:hypothetical protein
MREIKLEDVFDDNKRQGVKDLIDKHKQETLEEASWKYNPLKKLDGEFLRHAFKEGAKWQAERMYNKEKVDKLLDTLLHNNMCPAAGDELIEKFKKK